MPGDIHIAVLPLPTVEAIRDYVRSMLCRHEQLDSREAVLRQAKISRNGNGCGLMFQMSGPRLMRSYAVWAGAENRILFYDSSGVRFAETKITNGPDPAALAAAA